MERSEICWDGILGNSKLSNLFVSDSGYPMVSNPCSGWHCFGCPMIKPWSMIDDLGYDWFLFFMLSWFNITYIATTSFLCSQGTCDFCHVSITFNIMVMFCQTLSRHRDLGRGELLLQTCWYHQPPVVRTTNGLALYFVATFTPSKRQFWDVRLGYILLLPDQSVLWLPLWVYTWQWISGEINQYITVVINPVSWDMGVSGIWPH